MVCTVASQQETSDSTSWLAVTNKTNLQRSEKFETSVWSASQPIFTRIPDFTLNEYPVPLGDVDLLSSICQVSSLNIA